MILGGQHFVGALWQARKRLLKDTPEDQLPIPYRMCYGLVLGINAPWSACRSAAAAHQQTQHDTIETATADICALLMDVIIENKKRTGKDTLRDEELYLVLKNSGLVRGCREILEKMADETMSSDKALQYEAKQVCLMCSVGISVDVNGQTV